MGKRNVKSKKWLGWALGGAALVGLLAVCLATGAIGVRVDTVPAATYEMLTHAASLARAESLE